MSLELRPDPIQTKARRLIKPGNVATFALGRGTGKTWLAAAQVIELAFRTPGSHAGILYPTLKQARQVIWPLLWSYLLGPLRHHVVGKDKSQLEVWLDNGSRISTWGAENADGIRGQRFNSLVQDETDDIHPDVESAVVAPTFSKAGLGFVWAKFGTPRRGRYGILYRDFTRGQNGVPGFVSMRVKSSESPQVAQDWLERQRLITPPAIFAREYECDFDSAEGLVYPFDEAFHVRPYPDDVTWTEILIGCDHGWEDPGALVLIGVLGSGADATCWILDEIYEQHRQEDWWKARVRQWAEWWPSHKFYGDPSMPARIEAYKRDCGARVQHVDNSIEDGIAAVANRLAVRTDEDGPAARLYVAPSCKNTIRELSSYRRKRDPKNPEGFLEQTEDRNNHIPDALRYAIFNRFGPVSGTSPREFRRYDAR